MQDLSHRDYLLCSIIKCPGRQAICFKAQVQAIEQAGAALRYLEQHLPCQDLDGGCELQAFNDLSCQVLIPAVFIAA